MELDFKDISVFTSNSSAPPQRCWRKVFPTSDLSTSPRPGLPSAVPITRHLSASGHNLGVKECLPGCELSSFTSLPKTQSTKTNEHRHGTKTHREQLQHNLQSVSSPGAGRWVRGRAEPSSCCMVCAQHSPPLLTKTYGSFPQPYSIPVYLTLIWHWPIPSCQTLLENARL